MKMRKINFAESPTGEADMLVVETSDFDLLELEKQLEKTIGNGPALLVSGLNKVSTAFLVAHLAIHRYGMVAVEEEGEFVVVSSHGGAMRVGERFSR